MSERLILCIGTRKGLFVAESSKTRRKFELRGPFAPGVGVYSALVDKLRLERREWLAKFPGLDPAIPKAVEQGA